MKRFEQSALKCLVDKTRTARPELKCKPQLHMEGKKADWENIAHSPHAILQEFMLRGFQGPLRVLAIAAHPYHAFQR